MHEAGARRGRRKVVRDQPKRQERMHMQAVEIMKCCNKSVVHEPTASNHLGS